MTVFDRRQLLAMFPAAAVGTLAMSQVARGAQPPKIKAAQIGTTHAHTTAAEAFSDGKGVCQDHAHIFIGAAPFALTMLVVLALVTAIPQLALFLVYLGGYGLLRFAVEASRSQDALLLGLSLAQWICLLFITAAGLGLLARWRDRRDNQHAPQPDAARE